MADEELTPKRLAELYPRLFHMAEAGSWDSIRQRGLLSTTALLDLYGIEGEERERIESAQRKEKVVITHPVYGRAVIRDQKPMTDTALAKCLRDTTPREWYRLLNERVFFWVSPDRLHTLLNARAYRRQRQCVITVDTAALLERHADRVTLAPINTGSTIWNPQPRGLDTFRRISDYPYSELRKRRGKKDVVVELAVDHGVPDLRDFVLKVEHIEGGKTVEVLFDRR